MRQKYDNKLNLIIGKVYGILKEKRFLINTVQSVRNKPPYFPIWEMIKQFFKSKFLGFM